MKKMIIASAMVALSGLSHAQSFTAVDLGDLGGTISYANAINASGEVAGYSALPDQSTSAFIYSSGAMLALSPVTGDVSVAYGLNDIGEVVGYSGTSSLGTATVWSNGVATDLGFQPPPFGGQGSSAAYAVNNSGVVVGWSTSSYIDTPNAAVWSGGTLTLIGFSYYGVPPSFAYGINSAGQVVGWLSDPEYFGYVQIGTNTYVLDNNLSDGVSYGYAINANGQATGAQQANTGLHAALWTSVTAARENISDLGTLGGLSSVGTGINDSSLVVGWADTSSGTQHAALWIGNSATDLNTDLSPSVAAALTLTIATGINNSNWVVANGVVNATGLQHGYLLTTIPQAIAELHGQVNGTTPEDLELKTTHALNHVQAACTSASDFIALVQSQNLKKLSAVGAASLISNTEAIELAAGCANVVSVQSTAASTPMGLTESLESLAQGVGPASLENKASEIQSHLQQACRSLDHFDTQVLAHAGKSLAQAFATQLTFNSESIGSSIGCE